LRLLTKALAISYLPLLEGVVTLNRSNEQDVRLVPEVVAEEGDQTEEREYTKYADVSGGAHETDKEEEEGKPVALVLFFTPPPPPPPPTSGDKGGRWKNAH
jgi:hypothetical protein